MSDRKQRTIDLLVGDALKGDNYYEAPQNGNTGNTDANNSNAQLEVKTDDAQFGANEMDDNEANIRNAFDNIKPDKPASKLLLRIIQDS